MAISQLVEQVLGAVRQRRETVAAAGADVRFCAVEDTYLHGRPVAAGEVVTVPLHEAPELVGALRFRLIEDGDATRVRDEANRQAAELDTAARRSRGWVGKY